MVNICYPYRSATEYERLKPTYVFNENTDRDIAIAKLSECFPTHDNICLADCGAGPGLIWDYLPSNVSKLIGVEPNTSMWRKNIPEKCTYVKSGGFEFLLSTNERVDAVTWFWSLNYALLSYFETYDPHIKQVITKNWERGRAEVSATLSKVLQSSITSTWLVFFFDADSTEQSFVTDIWSREAPFPFHDRSFTRKLFEDVASESYSKANRQFRKEHYSGVAVYGDIDEAMIKIQKFHFRNHFSTNLEVQKEIQSFLSGHEKNRTVVIPSGLYVYTLQ